MLSCYSVFLVYNTLLLFTRGAPEVDFFEEDSTEFLTDIRIERSHGSRSKRSMVSNQNRLWPKGIVPFKIQPEALVDKEILRKGMHRWEERTCIRFVPWNSKVVKTLPHDDRINFFKEGRCRSVVGRYSIKQFINACNTLFGVIHELGHSIGLYHEHNRPDRDEHITMLWQNVPPEEAARYLKMMSATTNVEYDLKSIMHYGKYGPLGTKFVTVDPLLQYDVGPSSDITFYDAKSVNLAYNCSAKCSKKLKCINGGYQGHKCKCICPEKYMGKYCQKRNTTVEEKCRFSLTNQRGSVSSPNFPLHYDNKIYCMWHIKVKPNYKIVLNFTSFNVEPAPGCKADSVLLRTKDLYNGGESFCGFDLPPVITSSANEAWIRMYTDSSTTESGFHLNYYSVRNKESSTSNCWRRSCYRFFKDELTMIEAQKKCKSIGGSLPVISSSTENELLRRKIAQMLPGKFYYWIALNDMLTEGKYVWGSSREQSFYHNFETSPPSQIFRNIIDCVVSDVYGGWHERYCSWNASVVCEIWKSQTAKASFNKWSQWNDCPVSCGGSVQDRTRECNFPGECTGVARERRVCNTQPCPGTIARGKPTQASSVWRWDPAVAVDGYYWPKFDDLHASSLMTNLQYQPWWKVDIEDMYVVTGLRFTKCLGYDYRTPWADASVGFNNDVITNPVCSQVTLRHDKIQTTVECGRPLLGKIVGIQIKKAWTTLCITEVEVFTTGSALSCPRDIQMLLPIGESGVNVSWPENGSYEIGILEYCTHKPGSVFPEGVTTVQCRVRDTVNTAYIRLCSFRIEIIVCDIIRDSRCTRLIEKRQTRQQAQDACQQNGGNLLAIRSETQNKRVQSMIAYYGKNLRTPWIGYHDIDHDDTWTWSSGLQSPVKKLVIPKSKNDFKCATFKPNGYWRMTSCTEKSSAICETDIKFPTMLCPTRVSISTQTGYRNLYVYWNDDPIVIDPLKRHFTTSCYPKSGFNMRPGALKKITCTGNADIDGAVVGPCTFNVRACTRVSGNDCYVVTDDLLQWKDAKKRCHSLGGALVAIASSNQNTIVQNVFLRTYKYVEDVWIGYTLKTAGQSKYTNWEKELTKKDSKLCVTIKRDGKWIGVGCSQLRRSVCVINLNPETLTVDQKR
ncbi:uncharacterized protein LOC117110227 [Anneissia japonica]|uniref:uncharacterized protein LOC117110227 n=1 Tax=Anneissia japonica TaxID=1529436 RepID=UPI001425A9D1|nr:uncharacterized protein LOC117110227 [Anneissia japonica]